MLNKKLLIFTFFVPGVFYTGISLAGTVGFPLQLKNHTESLLTYSVTNEEQTDNFSNVETSVHDIAAQEIYSTHIFTTQTTITIINKDKKNGAEMPEEQVQIECSPLAYCSSITSTLNPSSPYSVLVKVSYTQSVSVEVCPKSIVSCYKNKSLHYSALF